jgi:hypothetical protein
MVMPFALARSNAPLVGRALVADTRLSLALSSTSSCRLPAPPARRPGPRPRVARCGAAGSGDMRSRVYDDGFSQSQRADESVLRAGMRRARGSVGRVASPAYERFGERMFCRHRDLARSGPTGGLIWRDFVCGTFP